MTTQDRITQLEKTLSDVQTELAALKQAEAEPRPFKEGDLIVRTGDTRELVVGNVYRVKTNLPDNMTLAYDEWGRPNVGRDAKYFRHIDLNTDKDKVREYLIKEAGYKGFKVGGYIASAVERVDCIERIEVAFNLAECPTLHVQAQFHRTQQPVPYAVSGCSNIALYASDCQPVKEYPITITVDGHTYIADFSKPDVVTFGCAQIDRHTIRRAADWVCIARGFTNHGNREVEGVQIGRGLFTRDLLKRLVERMDKQ